MEKALENQKYGLNLFWSSYSNWWEVEVHIMFLFQSDQNNTSHHDLICFVLSKFKMHHPLEGTCRHALYTGLEKVIEIEQSAKHAYSNWWPYRMFAVALDVFGAT